MRYIHPVRHVKKLIDISNIADKKLFEKHTQSTLDTHPSEKIRHHYLRCAKRGASYNQLICVSAPHSL